MSGPSFEFVDHTADLAARLSAPTAAGLFEAGAAAFTEALTDRTRVRASGTRDIELAAYDLDLLLVDWLHELLFLFETGHLLVADCRVDLTGAPRPALRATIQGEPRDPSRHPLKRLIKAVTYHGLHIHQDADGYHATVIFDI